MLPNSEWIVGQEVSCELENVASGWQLLGDWIILSCVWEPCGLFIEWRGEWCSVIVSHSNTFIAIIIFVSPLKSTQYFPFIAFSSHWQKLLCAPRGDLLLNKGHALRQNRSIRNQKCLFRIRLLQTYTHASSCRCHRSSETWETSGAGDGAGGGAGQCGPWAASPSRSSPRPDSPRSRGWSWPDGDLRGTQRPGWGRLLSRRQGQSSNRSGDPQWLRYRLKNMQALKNSQTQKNIQSTRKYLHCMRKCLTTLECSAVQRVRERLCVRNWKIKYVKYLNPAGLWPPWII